MPEEIARPRPFLTWARAIALVFLMLATHLGGMFMLASGPDYLTSNAIDRAGSVVFAVIPFGVLAFALSDSDRRNRVLVLTAIAMTGIGLCFLTMVDTAEGKHAINTIISSLHLGAAILAVVSSRHR